MEVLWARECVEGEVVLWPVEELWLLSYGVTDLGERLLLILDILYTNPEIG